MVRNLLWVMLWIAPAAPQEGRPPRKDLYGDPLPPPDAAARMGTVRLRHGSGTSCLAVSPDGRKVAAGGSDGTIRLREIATGKERRRFTGHRGSVTALSFSSDGRWLASRSADSTALLWDLSE